MSVVPRFERGEDKTPLQSDYEGPCALRFRRSVGNSKFDARRETSGLESCSFSDMMAVVAILEKEITDTQTVRIVYGIPMEFSA